MLKIRRYQTERNSETIAQHLAGFSNGLTKKEISETLGLEGAMDSTTLWRWLKAAEQQGLVEMSGNTSSARWMASEDLRRLKAREMINRPLSKRPLVSYNALWLADYEPNKSRYLSPRELSRLERRSPIGGAPIHQFDQHDMSMFLCGLPFGSSALEGNGYGLLDTIKLIEEGQVKMNASPKETQMILNHHDAVRYLIENINYPPLKEDIRLNFREIRLLHSLLSNGLLTDPGLSGRVRNSHVLIQDSSYTPLDIREALESNMLSILDKANKIENPYEQAFFLVVHLSYLQPFIDCNKRTARVACNIPLVRSGVVPMSWIGVDPQTMREALLGVYEVNDTSMMSEVFVDGYMRSVEHFNIMKQSREPDEVSIKYLREIRDAVRARVLESSDAIPPNVAPGDRSGFVLSVERELDALRMDDGGAMVRNRLKEGDIAQWMESQEDVPTNAAQERG